MRHYLMIVRPAASGQPGACDAIGVQGLHGPALALFTCPCEVSLYMRRVELLDDLDVMALTWAEAVEFGSPLFDAVAIDPDPEMPITIPLAKVGELCRT